ncbi:MAG: hypothetical protein ABI572_02620 [Actinomycetota bacterium]
MIRLLAAEWLGFRSRKIVRWLMVLTLIGIVVAAIIAGSVSHKPAEADLARAQQLYETGLADCIRQDGFSSELPAGTSVEEYCRSLFSESDYAPSGLRLDGLDEIVLGAAFIVVLIGLVIGASMVGAAWQSGTITTILTWEPRRVRWFFARLAVVGLGATLVAAVLLTVLAFAIGLATALRGTTATTTPWLADSALAIARIAVVGGGVSMIGAAVAMIGRHTAAALGAVFVYMAVLENIVRGLRPGLGRFLLGDNIGVAVTATRTSLFQGESVFVLTPQHGAVVIAVYVIVLVAAAMVLLRARDVN